jgi:branched-chain amino acid transport system substrate-binding protein
MRLQFSRRRGKIVVIAAVCVSAAMLSACGSSASNSAGTSKSGASTFTIGVVGSFSGVLASSFGSMPPTFTAWEKWTNAHGGVAGHPVNVIIDDDAASAATSITDVRQLVGQDHVPVLVDVSGVDAGWESYLAAEKEPALDDGGTPYTNYYFTAGTPLVPYLGIGSFAVAKAEGGTKLAFVYCADVSACTEDVPSAKDDAKEVGIKMVYASAAAADAPSYTPICLAAKAAGANVLNVYGPVSLQVDVANTCAQEGDKFIVVSSSLNFSNYWLKYKDLDGAIEDDPDFPVAYDGNPAAQAYHQAMQKYDPAELTNVNYGEANAVAWTTMQEAAQSLINAHVGKTATITSSDILSGLYKMDGNTLGGLAPPLNFSPTTSGAKINCWFTMAIANQAFTAPDGVKLSCYKGPVSS